MALEDVDGPPRVTAIKRRAGGPAVLTTSDGETRIVHAEALELAGIREGDILDHKAQKQLDLERYRKAARNAALRMLSRRPRSEKEMRDHLRQKRLPADVIAEEVERLKGAGLLDDEAFAHAWVGDRQESSPRGQRLLRHELLGRGVRAEIADEAVSSVDDGTAALAVARGRAPRLAGLEYRKFSQRLAGFLERRGFGYAEVETAVRTVWNENAEASERR